MLLDRKKFPRQNLYRATKILKNPIQFLSYNCLKFEPSNFMPTKKTKQKIYFLSKKNLVKIEI